MGHWRQQHIVCVWKIFQNVFWSIHQSTSVFHGGAFFCSLPCDGLDFEKMSYNTYTRYKLILSSRCDNNHQTTYLLLSRHKKNKKKKARPTSRRKYTYVCSQNSPHYFPSAVVLRTFCGLQLESQVTLWWICTVGTQSKPKRSTQQQQHSRSSKAAAIA